MLLVKRLLTALLMFSVIFVVLYVGGMMVGGGIAGFRATSGQTGPAPQDFNGGFNEGVKAGNEFRQQYGSTVGSAALGVAAVSALGLSFGGVLPWCRERKPPPLPPNMRYGGGTESSREIR